MPQIGVVEGRHVPVDVQVAVEPDRPHLAHRLRHLALHVLEQRDREAVWKGHVELSRNEGQDGRRQVFDDRVLDAVEIWPVLLPVIWVSCYLDILVRLERDEFDRAGSDRVLAQVACRHVAGIDRREPGSEQVMQGYGVPNEVYARMGP